MQISLKQRELEEAVRMYVASTGISRPLGEITFIGGRGDNGTTAEVEVTDALLGNTKEAALKTNVVDIPKAVEPAAKEEVVEEEDETDAAAGESLFS
jgi:hypothetical protein